MQHSAKIINHYETIWGNYSKSYIWDKGPLEKMPTDFRVLEFQPSVERNMWTYATCCLSQEDDENPIELHLFSSVQDESIIELLTSLSYYHFCSKKLDLWHTVNFGRPWQSVSICEYGLISLPYLDGPKLENLTYEEDQTIKFYWLIPISKMEVDYKRTNGIEALEQKFSEAAFDYLSPNRESVL